ncbi:MAG: cytochrome-c peroxidase [Acidimicrobiia bacterium]|nr:cytochrome-c peroxidase [Acidimicrobiia bacterium]
MRAALLLLAISLSASERLTVPLGLDQYIPAPPENPLRPDVTALGRDLFFDKRLSRDGTISCSSCHEPSRAFTDNRPFAIGIRGQKVPRRSPPIFNRAWGKSFFWDGRAETLEQQVLGPIANPKEMDLTIEELLVRLRRDPSYNSRFRELWNREPDSQTLAWALAGYLRTILAGDSPYDRFVAGDRNALTQRQQLGLRLFRSKANCHACHIGPNLTDERFHNTGTAFNNGQWTDPGRFAVTNLAADRGAFKTPSIREAAKTAPYMHNGSLATLEDVVDFYNKGGRANPFLDPEINPLNLSPEEQTALVDFLRALTGTIREGWPQ